MFTAKRNPELLQSRSGQRSHLGTGLLNFVEKALPRCLARKTRRLRSPGVLQMRGNPTEKVWEPKPTSGAFLQGEIEFARAFGHTSQSYLKGRFVRNPNYIGETGYSYASTAIQ
jgi:hypothetical protein